MRDGGTRGAYASARFGVLIAAAFAIAAAGTVVFSDLLSPLPVAGDTRDPDAVALATLGRDATQRAREGAREVVLRQVDVDPADPRNGWRFFRFVDGAAAREIDVRVPSPTALPSEWQVTIPEVSKLTGHTRPGLELDTLRAGPLAAARPITQRWPGCTLRSLTLTGQRAELTWYVSCTLSDGRVAIGTVDGRSGTFESSAAPPAYPPPTALPSR